MSTGYWVHAIMSTQKNENMQWWVNAILSTVVVHDIPYGACFFSNLGPYEHTCIVGIQAVQWLYRVYHTGHVYLQISNHMNIYVYTTYTYKFRIKWIFGSLLHVHIIVCTHYCMYSLVHVLIIPCTHYCVYSLLYVLIIACTHFCVYLLLRVLIIACTH